jgi:hypothetical protein
MTPAPGLTAIGPIRRRCGPDGAIPVIPAFRRSERTIRPGCLLRCWRAPRLSRTAGEPGLLRRRAQPLLGPGSQPEAGLYSAAMPEPVRNALTISEAEAGVPTRHTAAMRMAMRVGSSGARALAPHIAVACHVSTAPDPPFAAARIARIASRSFHGAGDSSHHLGRPTVAAARLGSPHPSWRAWSMTVSASAIRSTTRSPSARAVSARLAFSTAVYASSSRPSPARDSSALSCCNVMVPKPLTPHSRARFRWATSSLHRGPASRRAPAGHHRRRRHQDRLQQTDQHCRRAQGNTLANLDSATR